MQPVDPSKLMNSILVGLVSVTASCNNITPISALVVGMIGSLLYMLMQSILVRAKIDDPTEASHVHGFSGFWGALAVGIFDLDNGLIYTGSLEQLKIQTIGAVSCMLWTMLFCYSFFKILSSIKRFRVSSFYEIIGIDLLMHASIHDLSIQKFVADQGNKKGDTCKQGKLGLVDLSEYKIN